MTAFDGLAAGRPVGFYRLIERLGQDSLGEVWRGEHQAFRRAVKIRFLEPSHLAPGAALRVAPLTKGQHPHVVSLMEFRDDQEPPYLVHRYVEGSPLTEFLRQGPIAWPSAVEIVRQLLMAIEHVHSQGRPVGWLSPAAVLLTAEGKVLLDDLGLGLAVTPAALRTLPHEGLFVPSDLPPTQWGDIWALGTLLWAMVTGQAPSGQLGSVSSYSKDAPAALDQFIVLCRADPEAGTAPRAADLYTHIVDILSQELGPGEDAVSDEDAAIEVGAVADTPSEPFMAAGPEATPHGGDRRLLAPEMEDGSATGSKTPSGPEPAPPKEFSVFGKPGDEPNAAQEQAEGLVATGPTIAKPNGEAIGDVVLPNTPERGETDIALTAPAEPLTPEASPVGAGHDAGSRFSSVTATENALEPAVEEEGLAAVTEETSLAAVGPDDHEHAGEERAPSQEERLEELTRLARNSPSAELEAEIYDLKLKIGRQLLEPLSKIKGTAVLTREGPQWTVPTLGYGIGALGLFALIGWAFARWLATTPLSETAQHVLVVVVLLLLIGLGMWLALALGLSRTRIPCLAEFRQDVVLCWDENASQLVHEIPASEVRNITVDKAPEGMHYRGRVRVETRSGTTYVIDFGVRVREKLI